MTWVSMLGVSFEGKKRTKDREIWDEISVKEEKKEEGDNE